MKTYSFFACLTVLVLTSLTLGQTGSSKMAFTISVEDPNAQCYHVIFRCEGLKGASQDFKMPVWSPGYYGIFDFDANVQDFDARDDRGKPLPWEKTANNTWRVASDGSEMIVLNYRVKATTVSFTGDPGFCWIFFGDPFLE